MPSREKWWDDAGPTSRLIVAGMITVFLSCLVLGGVSCEITITQSPSADQEVSTDA